MTLDVKPPLPDQRARALEALTQAPLDVLVIGGGIVGAGVARDAAMRGLRPGLVEQHDFAFGTSSRSSRLLHGGIRYLAQGRLGLVRQASVEKSILHRIAPHLAQPLAFVFPTFRGTGWPLWQLRIGVRLYDLLCSGKNLGASQSLTKDEVLRRIPELKSDALTGAVRYFDGFTNDARLVLDTLRAAAKHGAAVLNYCKFETARRESGLWICQITELLSGKSGHVQARSVVNATGPWAEGLPHSQVKLRLTKGVHLIIERKRIPVPDAVVITEGHRVLFVIPWGERLIVGTTDTDYHDSLDDIRVEREDIDYLLRLVNKFFPRVQLTSADVISSYAGLRPLIGRKRGNDDAPSDISRAHQIRNPEPGWWDVAGGKLTTYRLMAEETVDQIVGALNRKEAPCRTAEEPLLPRAELNGESGILPPAFSVGAVEHYCANEWAVHLDDVMVRRTNWRHYFGEADLQAGRVAEWMAEWLGWSEAQRREELARYRATVHCQPELNPAASLANPRRNDP